MNPTVDELVAQAEQFSAGDRDLLLIRLQQALAPAVDAGIEAAWMAEVERRVEAMDRGEMRSVPWEEARKRLGL
ncbi:MAG: addiction module protein [Rhizobacter sp.]|nr:addiction module protein [Rhizobacter sp.]